MRARVTSPVVLVDLDGTLTDPRQGFINCARYALGRLDLACPSDDVLASFIGPPLRGTFAVLTGGAGAELVEKATVLFRERYAVAGIFENHVYDGVYAMLEAMRQSVSALFVATSKPRVYAERIVARLGFDRYCAGVGVTSVRPIAGPGLPTFYIAILDTVQSNQAIFAISTSAPGQKAS